ncbi:hypothetical protein ACJZ2D_009537 [Fusarium nematophilum]
MIKSRRGRATQSCDQCQRRKIKCDRLLPCHSCRHARKRDTCTYETAKARLAQSNRPQIGQQQISPSSSGSAAGASHPERAVANVTAQASSSYPEVPELPVAVLPGESETSRASPTCSPLTGGSFNKTRYFGPSHWLNGTYMFPEVSRLEHWIHQTNSPEAKALDKCKVLARAIKAARHPYSHGLDVADSLPPKDLSDKLVNAYLRTFETVHRILHVPSFLRQYQEYCTDHQSQNECFVAQLRLCLAIGAAMHDSTFTLRPLALRWIGSAQVWLDSPGTRARLNLPKLQVMCLAYVAGSVCKLNEDQAWISAGLLVRTAMALGLHRDPIQLWRLSGYVQSPKPTVFRIEMRRRLWATVIEIATQASIESGSPPLISTDDFDCQAPGNFDDDDLLVDDDESQPSPKPDDLFTESSVQIVLFRSLDIRLRIARFINGVLSDLKHAEALQLDAELTSACRSQAEALRSYLSSDMSSFQIHMVELMVHRFYFALHMPFIGPARSDPVYYYSRKVLLDTALKLFKAGRTVALHNHAAVARDNSDFCRLFVTATGPFWSVRIQTVAVIAAELVWRLEDGRFSLGFTSEALVEQELYAAVEDWVVLTEERIRAGETTVKDHITSCCCLEKVKAIRAGKSKGEATEAFFATALIKLETCHAWLLELQSSTLAHVQGRSMEQELLTQGLTTLEDGSLGDRLDWDALFDQTDMALDTDGILGNWFFLPNSAW